MQNKAILLLLALILWANPSFAQENTKPNSSTHPIAFGSNGICLTNLEGTSTIRLTNGDHGYPAWSPDGKRIAFYSYHDEKKTWSIHTVNSDGTDRKRLTHAKNKWDSTPSWSADGKKILFAREYRNTEGTKEYEIWIMNSDGSEEKQIKPLVGGNPSFTPDGRVIYSAEFKDRKSEIYIADVDGQNITPLTNNETNAWHPKVSPNGQQVAFSSDMDGIRKIYVMDIDGSNQRRLTDMRSGGPDWSPDGSHVVFQLRGEKEGARSNVHIIHKDGSSIRKVTSEGGWQVTWFKAEQPEPAVSLGQKSSLQSNVLNETIPLSIHLPANYDNSKKNYPVVYMLGSHFRAKFAMLASTLDYMGETQIPEMILIGIDLPNGNGVLLPNRENQDTTNPDRYIDFIETELIPHVHNTYRTAPFSALYGGSNSGFFTVYTLLSKPHLFNGYFASSPSLTHIPEVLKQKIKSGPLQTLGENRSLHIIYSDDEGLEDTMSEFSPVVEEHKPEGFTYKVDELVNQGHVPAADLVQFLLALFPDFNPFEDLNTLDKMTQHFDKLSKRYGYEIQPPISVVFNLGVDMIIGKNLVVAEEIFQYSIQVYPEGRESYLGMGVVRRDQGQLEDAKDLFEKALEIDPDYSLARRLLERLENQ